MNNTNQTNSQIHIVDVRTPGEFMGGHPEGAINIPLNELMGQIDRLKTMEGQIVFCCASGMRSGSATAALRQIGFNNVNNAGPWYAVPDFIEQFN